MKTASWLSRIWKSESDRLFKLLDRRRILPAAVCALLACAIENGSAVIIARITALVSICAVAFSKRLRKILISALIVFLAFSFYSEFRAQGPENLPTGTYALEGTVCMEPIDQSDKHRYVLTLNDCYADGEEIYGKVRLYLYEDENEFETGDTLLISKAKLSIADGALNPNGFDFKKYLWRNGVSLVASASIDDVELEKSHASLMRALYGIRRRLAQICNTLFKDSSDVMKAVLLGDRSSIDEDTYEDFSASGISHLIALSGLHISAIAMMLEFVLSRLRMPRGARSIAIVIFLSLYTLMTGASPSTVRALIMYALMCLSRQTGFYSDTLTRLCQALIIQLGINPLLTGDNGFVLTYASVGAILCFSDVLTLRLEDKNTVISTFAGSAKASFAVQMVTFPLLAMMFYRVPLLSVPVNVLCVPFAVLALYIGALVLIVGCVYQPIATILAYPVRFIWRAIKAISAYAAKLPMSNALTNEWSPWLLLIFCAIVIFGCAYMSDSKNRRLASIIALGITIAVSFLPKAPIDHLNATFLAVGEADSAVIDAQGHVYVVDCGRDNGITADYLLSTRANLSGIFITHADVDHYGGCYELLARYPNAKIYLPDCWEYMEVPEELTALFRGKTVRYLSQGDSVQLSKEIYAQVLWPYEGFEPPDDNSGSLVIQICYADASLIMMADLPDKYDALGSADSDIIKIAHHGSKYATTAEMLEIVTPEIAVISVGSNSYGHPTQEVIDRLTNVGAEIFRTDEFGAISMDIYEDGSVYIGAYLNDEIAEYTLQSANID